MCISLPARIVSLSGQTAQVEVNGLRRPVLITMLDAKVGDWVLIYGGAALAILDEASARESVSLIQALLPETKRMA